MKPIYSIQSLIRLLEKIPGARKLEVESIDATTGNYIAELMDEYRQTGKVTELSMDSNPAEMEDVEGVAAIGTPTFNFPGTMDAESVVQQLGDRADDHYRQQVLLRGVEALGYYSTFHQRQYQWGIYLPVSGLAWVVAVVFKGLAVPVDLKLRLACHLILSHEQFHFAADCAIAQIELLYERPIYWPRFASAMAQEVRELEETCANGQMLRRMRFAPSELTIAGGYVAARAFAEMQPPCYRKGIEVARSRFQFDSAILDHAQASILAATASEAAYGVEFQHLYPHDRVHDLARCPVHVISDTRRFGVEEIGIVFS